MDLKKLYDTYVVVTASDNNLVNVINSLFGCIVRLKEIHYSAQNMDVHKLSDDIISAVRGFEDRYSEISQSNGVVVSVGSIVVDYPQATDIEGVLNVLDTIVVAARINESVKNICDDFSDSLKQFRYLYSQIINK